MIVLHVDKWPDYASNLVFEIASSSSDVSQKLIRIIFNDNVMQLGTYPHTGALYTPEEIPRMVSQYPGWYALEDFVRFVSRLSLSNEQYQQEKNHVSTEDKEADEEAMLQNRNDLSATVTNSMKYK